jgi:hypothetical protein
MRIQDVDWVEKIARRGCEDWGGVLNCILGNGHEDLENNADHFCMPFFSLGPNWVKK